MNAKRQMATGMDLFFAVDTSYRYTKQRWGLMPVKTIGMGAKSHTIAYGFVLNETGDVHGYVYNQIKAEVEKVVQRRIADGATVYLVIIMFILYFNMCIMFKLIL